jgi:hypothetical protein
MKILPYTTKSGLQIGCRYEPPTVNHVSADGEFWQRVFLGIRPSPSPVQIMCFSAYCALLIVIFVVLGALL